MKSSARFLWSVIRLALASVAFLCCGSTGFSAAQASVSAQTRGAEELALTVSLPAGIDPTAQSIVHFPAGQVYVTPAGDRLVTLREATADMSRVRNVEVTIPCATVSLRKGAEASQPAQATTETEPKLAPLLQYLSTRNDVPRATSECAALALVHDITFQQWLEVAPVEAPAADPSAPPSPLAPPPALVQAIDAVGILRQIAPAQSFQLAADAQLKLRALRNPVTRAKALQLYGMTVPGDAATGAPPDLGQLLHTKPGDNCPICRMRAQMQGPASDL